MEVFFLVDLPKTVIILSGIFVVYKQFRYRLTLSVIIFDFFATANELLRLCFVEFLFYLVTSRVRFLRRSILYWTDLVCWIFVQAASHRHKNQQIRICYWEKQKKSKYKHTDTHIGVVCYEQHRLLLSTGNRCISLNLTQCALLCASTHAHFCLLFVCHATTRHDRLYIHAHNTLVVHFCSDVLEFLLWLLATFLPLSDQLHNNRLLSTVDSLHSTLNINKYTQHTNYTFASYFITSTLFLQYTLRLLLLLLLLLFICRAVPSFSRHLSDGYFNISFFEFCFSMYISFTFYGAVCARLGRSCFNKNYAKHILA